MGHRGDRHRRVCVRSGECVESEVIGKVFAGAAIVLVILWAFYELLKPTRKP